MAFSPDPIVLTLCQLSHAFSFAATHLGSIALLSRFAPEGARSRAQGMMSAITGGMTALLTLGSGWLFQHTGAGGFWAMVPLAVAGVALAAFAFWRQPQRAREGG
jgi:PPP family 3-phenylpropionic acid transporter